MMNNTGFNQVSLYELRDMSLSIAYKVIKPEMV